SPMLRPPDPQRTRCSRSPGAFLSLVYHRLHDRRAWCRQQLWQQSRRPKRNRTGYSTVTDAETSDNRNSAEHSGTTRRNLQNRRLQVRFLSHLPQNFRDLDRFVDAHRTVLPPNLPPITEKHAQTVAPSLPIRLGVIRPIPSTPVNQRALSGPAVIPTS